MTYNDSLFQQIVQRAIRDDLASGDREVLDADPVNAKLAFDGIISSIDQQRGECNDAVTHAEDDLEDARETLRACRIAGDSAGVRAAARRVDDLVADRQAAVDNRTKHRNATRYPLAAARREQALYRPAAEAAKLRAREQRKPSLRRMSDSKKFRLLVDALNLLESAAPMIEDAATSGADQWLADFRKLMATRMEVENDNK